VRGFTILGEPAHKCNHMMHLAGKRGGESPVLPKFHHIKVTQGVRNRSGKLAVILPRKDKYFTNIESELDDLEVEDVEIKPLLRGGLSNRYRVLGGGAGQGRAEARRKQPPVNI